MKDPVFREVDRVDRMAAKVAMETERLKKLKVNLKIIVFFGGGGAGGPAGFWIQHFRRTITNIQTDRLKN